VLLSYAVCAARYAMTYGVELLSEKLATDLIQPGQIQPIASSDLWIPFFVAMHGFSYLTETTAKHNPRSQVIEFASANSADVSLRQGQALANLRAGLTATVALPHHTHSTSAKLTSTWLYISVLQAAHAESKSRSPVTMRRQVYTGPPLVQSLNVGEGSSAQSRGRCDVPRRRTMDPSCWQRCLGRTVPHRPVGEQ
jgi:hypothetical protein